MKRIFCIAAAVLLMAGGFFSPPVEARNAPDILPEQDFMQLGIASFAFLKVTQSARAAGMGDAYAAVTGDIDAMFYNPAGLASVEKFGYGFSYTKWIGDMAFYSGAVAYKTHFGTLGVSIMNYDVGDMEVRTIYNPQGTGEKIKGGASVVGVAYAWKATDKLGVGVRASYVQETLHQDNVSSMVFDVGTSFYTGFRSARLALSMRNFGPDTEVLSESQKFLMPMYFNIGSAMEVYGELGDPASLTLSFESAFAVDYEQRWHIGGELWLANTLALRGGYKFNYDGESFSLGAGIKGTFGGRKITADVSYTDFGDLLDAPIRLSIGGEF